MSSCLDENAVLELIEGRLPAAARAEVEKHLGGCDVCRELASELAKDGVPSTARAEGLAQGTLAGSYRIEEAIGSGAAGIVYRAFDTRTNTRVALKYVTDQGLLARFGREAMVLSKLDHDAIVRYVGHGETRGGMYLAMEWLEGEDLEQRFQRGAIGWEGARTLGMRISAALSHAHALGCVHRDISPRNVYLPGGQLERAKLLDFGLVRIEDGLAARTATNAVLGTPFYMSPEQIRDPKSVTPASDLFGLGVLLYEAIAGIRPFDGDDLFNLWIKIVDKPHSPLPGWVPPPIAQLVDQLLQKDPRSRPRSAGEVNERLLGMSMVPVVVSAPPPAPPKVSRSGVYPAAIGVGLAFVICGGSLFAYVKYRPVHTIHIGSAREPEPDTATATADPPPVIPKFPLACKNGDEVHVSGDFQGTTPAITSVTGNCKIVITNSKIHASTLFETEAGNVELTLEDVVLETTDIAASAGTNFTVRIRGSTINGNLIGRGNFELAELANSKLKGSIDSGGSNAKLNIGSGTVIGDIHTGMNGQVTLSGGTIEGALAGTNALTVIARKKSTIRGDVFAATNLTVDLDESRLEGTVKGPINLTVRLRNGARTGSVVGGTNLILEANKSTIEGGESPGVSGTVAAQVTLRGGRVQGKPALAFVQKPMVLVTEGVTIEGDKKIGP